VEPNLTSQGAQLAGRYAAQLLVAHRYIEAKAILDEAIGEWSEDYRLRLQRARLLARLGLNSEVLVDLQRARRLLPKGDVQTFLEVQSLERLMAERSRSGFVRPAELPHLPRWLLRLAGVRRDSAPVG
jgi:hypothetical protein